MAVDKTGDASYYNSSSWHSASFDGTAALTSLSCTGTFCLASDARGALMATSGGAWNVDVASDTPASSADTTTLSYYDPDGTLYCSVGANAYAKGPLGYQCPTWQAGWVATPPNPVSEYSSSPTSTQAESVTLSFDDPDGNQIQSSNPDGDTTVSDFDPAGRVYCAIDATNVAAYLSAHPGASYPYSCPTTPPTSPPATGSDPGYSTTIYDGAGRTVSTTDPDGNTTANGWVNGELQTVTDADGNVTTNCSFSESCASAGAGQGLATSLYTTTRPPSQADSGGEVTTTTYEPGGQVHTSSTPAGTTTSTYDANGDLLKDAYSNTASGYSAPTTDTYTYYQDGSRETMSDGTGTTTYTYDDAGDTTKTQFVHASGSGLSDQTMSYGFDAVGQVGTVTYPTNGSGTPSASYAYNSAEEMSSVTDWSSTPNSVDFSYDQDGNEILQANAVTSSTPNGTSATAWSYDAADQLQYTLTSYLPPTSGISPQVQGAGGSSGTSSSSSQAQVAKQLGLSASSTNPFAGIALPQGFAAAGTSAPSGSGGLQAQTTCTPSVYFFGVLTGDGSGTRNADGDITSETMADSSNCGTVYSDPFYYTLDPASRVVYNANVAQGASANNVIDDPAGNTTQISTTVGPQSYTQTVDSAGEVTKQTPTGSGTTSTFTYDSIGDQTKDVAGSTTTTSSFNQLGQMVSSTTGSTTTSYQVNGDGLLISDKVGSTFANQLTWGTPVGSEPLVMSNGNDDFIYGPGTTPVEQYYVGSGTAPSSNPTFLNYADDGLSTDIITSTSGAYTNGQYYDLFGTPAATFTAAGSVFGYEGQYTDGYGSGLVNMRARWYRAGTGTFTSVDPDVAETNQAYAYADDDPVNGSDPTGLNSNTGTGALGAEEAAAATLANNIKTPEDFAVALLFWMNLSIRNTNVQGLLDWESSENSAFPDYNNQYTGGEPGLSGYHNPLNTGFLNFTSANNEPLTPGASRPNGAAAAYPTWIVGVEATAFSIGEHQYSDIYRALAKSEGPVALQTAVLEDDWGTGPWSTAPLPPYIAGWQPGSNCAESLR
jgi:RHS repeat-associated protein